MTYNGEFMCLYQRFQMIRVSKNTIRKNNEPNSHYSRMKTDEQKIIVRKSVVPPPFGSYQKNTVKVLA